MAFVHFVFENFTCHVFSCNKIMPLKSTHDLDLPLIQSILIYIVQNSSINATSKSLCVTVKCVLVCTSFIVLVQCTLLSLAPTNAQLN